MSDQEQTMMLEADESSGSDVLIPAIILGGAALFYKMSKSQGKSSEGRSYSGEDSKSRKREIHISIDMKKVTVGSSYSKLVLEPFLSEQAEDGHLLLSGEGEPPEVDESRSQVIKAFKKTHEANFGDSKRFMSSLAKGTRALKDLDSYLNQQVKSFQETY